MTWEYHSLRFSCLDTSIPSLRGREGERDSKAKNTIAEKLSKREREEEKERKKKEGEGVAVVQVQYHKVLASRA